MKNDTLITIGILCFNAEHTILNAIEGAINQTYKKKEIIVIDDFSEDNSYKIIKDSKYIKHIKLIQNSSNLGISFSRNRVIKNSKGDFICFMDDDDISEKDRVKKQVKSIFQSGFNSNDCVLSICNIFRRYKSGYLKEMSVFGTNGLKPLNEEFIDFLLFNKKNPKVDYGFGCPTCAMMISKKCFNLVGIFDEKLQRVEDMDLTIRLCKANCKFIYSKDTFIRQFSTSGNDKSPLINLKSEIKIIKKNKEYLLKKRMYLYSRLWPYLRYYYFKKNYFLLIMLLIFLIIINPIKAINHFLESSRKRWKHESRIKNGSNNNY